MTGPGLKPHQRRNAAAYVVADDLRELELGGGLVQRFAGELGQWRLHDELSLTACAILAVLSVFRGLRSGADGCGVQAPLEAWATLLGRSRRMVAYAFDELGARGYVWRRRRLLKHAWTDAQGTTWRRCDIHGVAYLSRKALVRINRRGETRRLTVKAGKESRVLVAAGVVGRLLVANSAKLKLLARRVTDAAKHCTPSFGGETRQKRSRGRPPGALFPGAQRRTPAQARNGPAPPSPLSQAAQTEGGRALTPELIRSLAASGRLLPWLLWPSLWLEGGRARRRWLSARCDALGASVGAPRRRRELERQHAQGRELELEAMLWPNGRR